MDTLDLSRIQFAVTTLFHILFPTLTMGLSVYLVAIESLWLWTKDERYYRMYRYWVKFFSLNFGVGVVTGIVLEFEFGTNFSAFSQRVSNVLSPLLSFEVMTAFFLESSFLGIMLFGWNKVSRQMHFLATCMVAVGTILSAFWILAANSWMQTPAGYSLVDGTFMITDFSAALFNPSALVRITHMTTAALETSVFVVAGVSAYFLLKGRHSALFRRSLGIALVMAALFAPLQVFVGDLSGRHVVQYQPAKAAAIESHWETNTTRRCALCRGRSSRHAGGEECFRHIRTERPQPAGHSHSSWPGSGPQGIPAGRPSECPRSVLVVSGHGGNRIYFSHGHGMGLPSLEERESCMSTGRFSGPC